MARKGERERYYEMGRRREIISLWLKRSENERTSHYVLAFYGDLQRTASTLLSPKTSGDHQYQELHSILKDHILGDQP